MKRKTNQYWELIFFSLLLFTHLCSAATPPTPLWGPGSNFRNDFTSPSAVCEDLLIDLGKDYESYELVAGDISSRMACIFYGSGHKYGLALQIGAACPSGQYPYGLYSNLRPSTDNSACICPPGDPIYAPDYQTCIREYYIGFEGPDSTRILPAGPSLNLSTIVKENGILLGGMSVTISTPGGKAITGQTDTNGRFSFNYIPPKRPGIVKLTAYCASCYRGTAEKNINITGIPMCRAEPGDVLGNPISPSSGTKIQIETDWQDQGVNSLNIIRTYRSSGDLADIGLGKYWSHSYAAQLTGDDLQRTAHLGNGILALFTRSTPRDPWSNDSGEYYLEQNTLGWRIARLEDDAYWQFDIKNVLIKTGQRNGWTMSFTYTDRMLTEVTNTFGRKLQFAYDEQGHLSKITAPNGQVIKYIFDSTGRTISVQYPDNSQKTYLYENSQYPNALTGINDERGKRYATFGYDEAGRAVSTSHAGDVLSYRINYPVADSTDQGILTTGMVDDSVYQSTVLATDSRGNQQTWSYQGGDGTVRVSAASGPYEGAAVAKRTFIDRFNLPAIETDFMGNSTGFEWDVPRRLLLKTTRAVGTPIAQTVQTQWHPSMHLPLQRIEADRTITYTYDALGNKLSQTITGKSTGESRTIKWTYNELSLVTSTTDARGKVWTYGYDGAGNTTTVTNPLGHVTRYSYNGAGQITQIIDPNGVVTANSYDARQRLLSSMVAGKTISYFYDASGLLIRATKPDASWLGFEYDAAHRLTAMTDNLGNRINYTLDSAGNRIAQETKDPAGVLTHQITRIYNASGRLQKTFGLE